MLIGRDPKGRLDDALPAWSRRRRPMGKSLHHREHVQKALQAAVYQYIEVVKIARGLG